MDRRDFLKGLGLGAAALGLGGCKSTSEHSSTAARNGSYASRTVPENMDGVGLLGFGCMRWPMNEESGEIDQEAVNTMVDEAMAHGVNYFDSAPVYLGGKSEEATATALRRHPRESYYIATKCSLFRGTPTFEAGESMYRRSLEIYGTDHIDYYLLHSVGDYESFKAKYMETGLIDFFLREREAGHIRHLGFSCHGTRDGFDQMIALHERYHWDFVQIQMNYRDWRYAERGATAGYMYGVLESKGIPVVIMEPLLGGRLADIPASLADKLKEREPSQSIASWAFRFCGSFKGVLTVLSGMTCMEHLQDNLRTFTDLKTLNEEEFALLDEIALLLSKYPLINCTGCEYCMPCPYGVNIPGVFKFYNDRVNEGTYITDSAQEGYARAKRRYLLKYDKAVASLSQAAHCIGCNHCASVCPQHIKISKEMRRIDTYIERLRRDTLKEG